MDSKAFFRSLLLCSFLSVHLLGGTPKDITFFDDKPAGVAKDFYIYRYLKKPSTTSQEAWKLLEQTTNMSMKLFHAYANKLDDAGTKKVSNCLKMKLKVLLKSDDECLAIKFSPYYATLLSKDRVKDIEKRLKNYDISNSLKVIYSKDPFESMINGNSKLFFDVFNRVGSSYRVKFLDHEITKQKIKELEKSRKFNTTVKYVVTGRKMKQFNKSLIFVDRFSKNLTHKTLFFLGLNALQLRYNTLAMAFFDEAYKKAFYRMDKDKLLFWQFLVSNDPKYKDAIKKSFDINIYTLLMDIKNDRIITAKATKKNPNYDEKNPFGWTKLHNEAKNKTSKELKKIAQEYKYSNTIPIYSYLMEKASRYQDHYFALPFTQYLKKSDNQRVALIMAISRQESRLIPSALSHSYAMGMMQFMPFLSRAIAKQEGMKGFDVDDMFDPKTALKFANIHLDWLERSLYNPLFIAYAYNGGIGFTKKLLLSGTFKKGEYEPFLSMELVHYDESRKYAKKVLANYIVYMNILGEKVSIHKLVGELTDPSKTDRFRGKTN